MIDNIPPTLGAIIFGVLALTAMYRCYILPGYLADREKNNGVDTTTEDH